MTLKIEKVERKPKAKWADVLDALSKMRVGSDDSFVLPLDERTPAIFRMTLYTVAQRAGYKVSVTSKGIKNGVRVWRVK